MLRIAASVVLLLLLSIAPSSSSGAPLCAEHYETAADVRMLQPGESHRIGIAAAPERTPPELGEGMLVPDPVAVQWQLNTGLFGVRLVELVALADDDAHRGEFVPELLLVGIGGVIAPHGPPGLQVFEASVDRVCLVFTHADTVPAPLALEYAATCTLCQRS